MREESLNEACIRYLLVYFMDFLFLLTLEKQAVVLCQKQRQQTFGVFLFFCNYLTINPQHKLDYLCHIFRIEVDNQANVQ